MISICKASICKPMIHIDSHLVTKLKAVAGQLDQAQRRLSVDSLESTERNKLDCCMDALYHKQCFLKLMAHTQQSLNL